MFGDDEFGSKTLDISYIILYVIICLFVIKTVLQLSKNVSTNNNNKKQTKTKAGMLVLCVRESEIFSDIIAEYFWGKNPNYKIINYGYLYHLVLVTIICG